MSQQTTLDYGDFVQRLRGTCQKYRPVESSRADTRKIFVHPELEKASHVFVRLDSVKKPFQRPYDGSFRVVKENPKYYTLDLNGRQDTVTLDWLKPAFVLHKSGSGVSHAADPVPALIAQPILSPSSQASSDTAPAMAPPAENAKTR
ncbi:hypothetical protein GE061_015333 [Apolygus lucorum]|uniref:Uncharacterized protein n=1 Tax=Apolygus lucorum TaxID=248454 RepID=A0A8S9XPQ8_APOLU|nr:hypothetical protein GE061_015333 [Apolygus lucorum]